MTVKQSDADQLQKQKNAKMAMLRYQASKSIDAQGDKMTMPGLTLGALTGAAIGSMRGSHVLPLAAVGGAAGMLGLRMAGRMDERRRLNNLAKDMKKTNLQALKPALRELAARSEQLKEFAMVRDASGRYVEVEEDGFPVGAAVKAGAGAAALGGAGYGAYRGHKAIMGAGADAYAQKAAMTATAADRVGGVGAVPIAQRNANFKIAKAGAAGNFDRMGFMDRVKTGYGMAGKSALNTASSKPGLLGKLGRFALKLR